MATPYTLKPGETLASVADRHGLRNARVIFDAPLNLSLRSARKDPAQVQPGDTFMIPDRDAINTARVELQATVTDSVSGAIVSGITFELDVPDGVSRTTLEREARIGRLMASNR